MVEISQQQLRTMSRQQIVQVGEQQRQAEVQQQTAQIQAQQEYEAQVKAQQEAMKPSQEELARDMAIGWVNRKMQGKRIVTVDSDEPELYGKAREIYAKMLENKETAMAVSAGNYARQQALAGGFSNTAEYLTAATWSQKNIPKQIIKKEVAVAEVEQTQPSRYQDFINAGATIKEQPQQSVLIRTTPNTYSKPISTIQAIKETYKKSIEESDRSDIAAAKEMALSWVTVPAEVVMKRIGQTKGILIGTGKVVGGAFGATVEKIGGKYTGGDAIYGAENVGRTIVEVGPYFIPVVGEALAVGFGSESVVKGETTGEKLGGLAMVGFGVVGAGNRVVPKDADYALKMPRKLEGTIKLVTDTAMTTKNIPKNKILEDANMMIPSRVKSGSVTEAKPINPRAYTEIISPTDKTFKISEVSDTSGNVVGRMVKGGGGRGLFKKDSFRVDYAVNPKTKEVTYNIFKNEKFIEKRIESGTSQFGFTEPSLISKTKLSKTKVLKEKVEVEPGVFKITSSKIKQKTTLSNKKYRQELVSLEKTNKDVTGEFITKDKLARVTTLSPAKENINLYKMEVNPPKEIKAVFTRKKLTGKFSKSSPPDIEVIKKKQVKLNKVNEDVVKGYHSTSDIYAKDILNKGLLPAKETGISSSATSELRDFVSLGTSPEISGYGARTAIKKGGKEITLEVNIPKQEYMKLQAQSDKLSGIGNEIRVKNVPAKYIRVYKPGEVNVPNIEQTNYALSLESQTPRFKDVIKRDLVGEGKFTINQKNIAEKIKDSNFIRSKKSQSQSQSLLQLVPEEKLAIDLNPNVAIPRLKASQYNTKFDIFIPENLKSISKSESNMQSVVASLNTKDLQKFQSKVLPKEEIKMFQSDKQVQETSPKKVQQYKTSVNQIGKQIEITKVIQKSKQEFQQVQSPSNISLPFLLE